MTIPAHQFAIVALDGCYGSSLHGLVDVLVVANAHLKKQLGQQHPPFKWQFFTSQHDSIETSNGLTMSHPRAEHSEQQFDVIYIPGIWYQSASHFSQQLDALIPLYQWLIKQHTNGAIICGNCTATFMLAQTGLLDNKSATTVWWIEHLFRQRYPSIELKTRDLIIEQNNLITASAATSHFQLGLHIIAKFIPGAVVQQVAKTMLIDTRKSNIAAQLILSPNLEHDDHLVQQAQDWISRHLELAFSIAMLASKLATSERTLTRHFNRTLAITPIKYVQAQRIDRAKYLLETSELSLDAIIEKVGYQDKSTFSKLFDKHTGIPPMSYRRQFRR
jgi:transcriptional regulator GlxA family with amidase domain